MAICYVNLLWSLQSLHHQFTSSLMLPVDKPSAQRACMLQMHFCVELVVLSMMPEAVQALLWLYQKDPPNISYLQCIAASQFRVKLCSHEAIKLLDQRHDANSQPCNRESWPRLKQRK